MYCLKFLIICAFCLLGFASSQSFPPFPTPADKINLLRRDDLRLFLGLNRMRDKRLLPAENKVYKCRILSALLRNVEVTLENTQEKNILTLQLRTMLEGCSQSGFRSADLFNQTFVFPGTKWCGQGNVAENYHDLGAFNETDACCRDHDFCDDIIQSGKTKHNLINPYGTTRLHCKCDAALRQCFRNVRSVIANTVGYIFFSLLQTQCFDFDYPTTGCEVWRRGAVRLYCVQYKKNTNAPKMWQWFDQEPYF